MTLSNCARVLLAIRVRASTCDDVERATGLMHQQASARMRDLAKRRRIVPTGKTRKTRLGRMAMVWRAAK